MQDEYTIPTVEIPLFRITGEIVAYTTIDAVDLPLVEDHVWRLNNAGYAYRCERRNGVFTNIFMHRVILGLPHGVGFSIVVDHIDHVPLNNARSNLRKVTMSENQQNLILDNNGSTSPYRGVSWNSERGKWVVQVQINRKKHNLGYYHDMEEAAKVASDYRREHMTYANED